MRASLRLVVVGGGFDDVALGATAELVDKSGDAV